MDTQKRNFDIDAATWDEEPRRVQLAKDLFRAICESAPLTPSTEALDFGCGTGLVTLQLATQAGRVTGVDSSRGMLEVLEQKLQSCSVDNVATRFVDLDAGDVLDGAFDLVVSTMTLHHIRDVDALLKQSARVVKPGGRIALADLDSENGEFHTNNEGVFHLGFDRGALMNSLARVGFTGLTARTAAEVAKPGADGSVKAFPIFLITGRKPESGKEQP